MALSLAALPTLARVADVPCSRLPLIETVGWNLGEAALSERDDRGRRLQRRLYAFSRRLARDQDDVRMYGVVLRTLASQVDARMASLAIFDEADQALRIVTTIGYPLSIVEHLRVRPGEGILGEVFESGRAVSGNAGAGGVRRLRYRTDSYLVLPIRAGRGCLAVAALTDHGAGGPFDARDLTDVRVMASVAAPALSRATLRAQLARVTELATVDTVTGLFNRRYFERRIEAEFERARRRGQDLALLLIDIDDFKKVNDTHGHLEGDRTLRQVADLVRAGVRAFDMSARYGGEEFVIVMPAASDAVAHQVAERIRARVEQTFSHQSPAVTVSVGIGMLGSQLMVDDLFETADRALMAAKQSGKNVVRVGAVEGRTPPLR